MRLKAMRLIGQHPKKTSSPFSEITGRGLNANFPWVGHRPTADIWGRVQPHGEAGP